MTMRNAIRLTKRLLLSCWIVVLAAPTSAWAANTIPGFGSTSVDQVKTSDTLSVTLDNLWAKIVVRGVFPFLSGLAVLFVLYAGYQYITSAGDASKAKVARQNIINVILGIIVLMTVYSILGLIIGILRYFAAGA